MTRATIQSSFHQMGANSAPEKAVMRTRMKAPKAAALTATDMKAVTGAGAPS